MDLHCISVDLFGRNQSGQDYDNVDGFQSLMLHDVQFNL